MYCIGKSLDWWFYVQGYFGLYVLVCLGGKDFDLFDIFYVVQFVVLYFKVCGSSNVLVDYICIKYVWWFWGVFVGQVYYIDQKIVFVDGD